jgi:hypothetical protein
MFAEVQHFLLYDLFTPEGHVNEDVFAYSNRSGEDRSLVVYHNRFASARGWIRNSAAYSTKDRPTGGRRLRQETLGEGLGLHCDANTFCLFRDLINGLEYIRNSKELCESGLYVELDAYRCHVFLDFREVQDNDWHQYAHLATYLDGRGVPSIEEALREVFLQPVHGPFRELVHGSMFHRIMDGAAATRQDAPGLDPPSEVRAPGLALLLDDVESKMELLLQEIKRLADGQGDASAVAGEVRRKLEAILRLPDQRRHSLLLRSSEYSEAGEPPVAHPGHDVTSWGILLGWLFTHALGKAVGDEQAAQRSRSWLDEWLLGRIVAGALQDFGLDQGASSWVLSVIKPLITYQDWCSVQATDAPQRYSLLRSWLADEDVQQVLQVNRYRDTLFFNREAFEQLLHWMLTVATVVISSDPVITEDQVAAEVAACSEVVTRLRQAGEDSEYRVAKLLEAAR